MAKKKAAPAKPTIDQRIDAFSISEERLDNAIENLKYLRSTCTRSTSPISKVR